MEVLFIEGTENLLTFTNTGLAGFFSEADLSFFFVKSVLSLLRPSKPQYHSHHIKGLIAKDMSHSGPSIGSFVTSAIW